MRSGYLRAPDVARLLNVSTRTVRRWIAEGALPSVKIGGARLVAEHDLDRALGQGSGETDTPEISCAHGLDTKE